MSKKCWTLVLCLINKPVTNSWKSDSNISLNLSFKSAFKCLAVVKALNRLSGIIFNFDLKIQ